MIKNKSNNIIRDKLNNVSLKMDSGKEVKNLKELQENFSIMKIVGYIKDGTLVSWLKHINLHDYATKIQMLDLQNPYLIERIYCIFGIKWNDDIEKSKYSVLDIIKKRVKINIIATMSSGKSTLINALLGNKLMPSKHEACTAIITEIEDMDNKIFSAKVYNKNGQEIRRYNSLTYKMMQDINYDERVSKVCINGDIPFVNSQHSSLILVDTPGPNNSRDESHKEVTYNLLKNSSDDLFIYIMNATQLAVNDDRDLLKYIAKCMKENKKQARDRFIFVLNKLDEFRNGEDSVESTLKNVKEYLRDEIEIENPNIYPVSALTALQIRTLLSGNLEYEKNENIDLMSDTFLKISTLLSKNSKNQKINDDELDEANLKVKKFNRQEQLHLEKYAPLPKFIKKDIEERLKRAKERGDKIEEALIHTGIISLEEAIKFYLRTKTIDFILVD